MKGPLLHFIFTGGTIDSHYDGAKDTVVPNKHSIIPDFLKSAKFQLKAKYTEICMKDSRQMLESDINKIINVIGGSTSKKFIITHGTYTMADTARYLKAKLKCKDKTVVLTGSLTPIEGFSYSDGPFNLGYAIAKALELPPGVYVCIHAKTYAPEEVAKNMAEGLFYSIFEGRAPANPKKKPGNIKL